MQKGSIDVLAHTYVSIQRDAWDVEIRDVRALEETLAAAFAAGRAAFPGVELDASAFAAWIADRAPEGIDPVQAVREMHTTDLFLACGCARGDAKALHWFETRIMPSVAPAVARIDPDPEFAAEVAQDVRVKLLVDAPERPARIRSYIGRGPLTSFVQVAAMRTAYSMKRIKVPAEQREELEDLPILVTGAEEARFRAEFVPPFRVAFREALGSLSTRDRNVLRLYLVEGVSAEAIGRMYRVHRATVARWLAETYDALLSETRKRMEREHGITRKDFDSFVGLLRSQLEVSLASALGQP